MRLYLVIILIILVEGLGLKQNRWYNTGNRYNYRVNSIVENQDTVVGRCTSKIQAALNPTMIKVTASNEDPNGSHIQIVCVSKEFEGKNSLARQRMIYKAIWDEMSGPVHACDSIVAKTPAEMEQ